MTARPDSVLLADAHDAISVVDDFVRGVLGVAGGEIGGAVKRRWKVLHFTGFVYGEKQVVQGMGAQYGSEQLRKAANAADEMAEVVGLLREARTQPAIDALAQLLELDVFDVPRVLRDPDVTAGSGELRQLHLRLSRMLAALNEARTKTVLFEMRSTDPPA